MDLRKFDRFSAIMRPEQGRISNVMHTNNTLDIPGAQPDAYGRLRFLKGRDGNNISDINGAKPNFMERPPPINKEHYTLQTKDITEEHK
jgi:hypothetical protein